MDLVKEALAAELPKLAVDFFIVFSRFECALKRSGEYAVGDEARVSPNWDGFSRDLGSAFLKRVIAEGIAPFLVSKPPKQQVLTAGGLGWRDVGAVKNTTELFVAIRRVRNKLAHGAKYQDGGAGQVGFVEGSERDDALLEQSLAVMELALEMRPDIYAFFRRH